MDKLKVVLRKNSNLQNLKKNVARYENHPPIALFNILWIGFLMLSIILFTYFRGVKAKFYSAAKSRSFTKRNKTRPGIEDSEDESDLTDFIQVLEETERERRKKKFQKVRRTVSEGVPTKDLAVLRKCRDHLLLDTCDHLDPFTAKVLKVLYPKVLNELSESPKLSSMEVRRSMEDVDHSTRFSIILKVLTKSEERKDFIFSLPIGPVAFSDHEEELLNWCRSKCSNYLEGNDPYEERKYWGPSESVREIMKTFPNRPYPRVITHQPSSLSLVLEESPSQLSLEAKGSYEKYLDDCLLQVYDYNFSGLDVGFDEGWEMEKLELIPPRDHSLPSLTRNFNSEVVAENSPNTRFGFNSQKHNEHHGPLMLKKSCW